jgi:type IV pilus assembly protein PilF
MKKGWTRIGMVLAVALLFTGCATEHEKRQKAKIHMDMAAVQIQSGNYSGGLKELLDAEKLTPEDPKIHYLLAYAYGGKGMNDDAVREAKKAVELKPDYSEAYNYLGTVYLNMGQYDRAIDSFNKALANPLYETPSLPLYNMGRAYYQKGDYLVALAKYDEAVAKEPNTVILPLIEKDRGIASLKAGYANKAITHLKKSVELVPNLVEAHYWLGEAYLTVKNRRDAAGEFKTVINLAPDSDYARMARQKLDRL